MTTRFLRTFAVPGIAVLAYALARVLYHGHSTVADPFWHVESVVMQALSLTGCVLGMTCFDRGDYLRRAWGLYVVGDVVFIIVLLAPHIIPPHAAIAVRVIGDIIANVVGPIGSYLFARTWFVAGIELTGGRWTRRSGMLAGFAIGAAFGLPGLLHAARGFSATGDPNEIIRVASMVGDMANFTFTAPILLTALALRGGSTAWVWLHLSLCSLSWLGYDLVESLSPADASPLLPAIVEGLRTAALSFMCAAGVAQRMVLAPVPAEG